MSNDARGARMTSLATVPAASATEISQGDQCYWDSSNNRADPFSEQTDNVGEEDNQAEAAINFLGICAVPSNDGDTEVTIDTGIPRLVHTATVPSGTYRFGTLLGPSEAASGTALEDQQLEAVTSLDLATHMVWDDDSSARTSLECAVIRSYAGRGTARKRAQTNTETLAGTKTLTFDDAEIHFLDPDGSGRNVDLPAEEESAGLTFVIVNTAGGAEVITVRNDAGTTICTPTQNEVATLFCDGTTWAGSVGANS